MVGKIIYFEKNKKKIGNEWEVKFYSFWETPVSLIGNEWGVKLSILKKEENNKKYKEIN